MLRTVSAVLILAIASCTTAPRKPQKGTAEFYWQAAIETFDAGDYVKTAEHLDALLRKEDEYTARAYPWALVLNAGLAAGYLELADAFEAGGRANKTNPTPFRKSMNDYRALANRTTLSFAERYQKYLSREVQDPVPLAYPLAAGSAAPNPVLGRIAQGILATDTEIADAQRRTLERGILLAQARAAGAEGDIPKLRELFRSGQYEAPRASFLLAMANFLYDQSQLYIERKLNQPDRRRALLEMVDQSLKNLPDSPERRELNKKVAAERKGLKS